MPSVELIQYRIPTIGVGIGADVAIVAGPPEASRIPNQPTPTRPTTASCALRPATAVLAAGRSSPGSRASRPRDGIVVVAPTPTVASCATAGDAVSNTAV